MAISITYRSAKGANLTAAEVDANFKAFEDALNDIINNPPTAVGISNIVVQGSSVLFYKTDGSTFGPFPLPYVTFRIRPDFDSSIANIYAAMDLIPVPGVGLFLSRGPKTYDIGDPFDPDALDDNGDPLYIKVFGENTFIYEFGFFYPNRPGVGVEDGANLAGHLFVNSVILPAGLSGSRARLKVAPAADLSFPIYQNDTEIGSIDFATGETDATFTFASDVTFVDGDVCYLRKPAALDTAARELIVTFNGLRSEGS